MECRTHLKKRRTNKLLQILKIMSTNEERPESLVAAVAPTDLAGVATVGTGKIDFNLKAEEYQGYLRLKSTCSMAPHSLYMDVYQTEFPADPNTKYVKEEQIESTSQTWDTGLVWGKGYRCSIMIKTYTGTYDYQYVCQLTT
jgi:hypothetical protein